MPTVWLATSTTVTAARAPPPASAAARAGRPPGDALVGVHIGQQLGAGAKNRADGALHPGHALLPPQHHVRHVGGRDPDAVEQPPHGSLAPLQIRRDARSNSCRVTRSGSTSSPTDSVASCATVSVFFARSHASRTATMRCFFVFRSLPVADL